MEKLKTNCHACRNDCEIEVEYENGEVTEVTGNGCMRGMMHAQSEERKIMETLAEMPKK